MSENYVVLNGIFRILISTALRVVLFFYIIASAASSIVAQSPIKLTKEVSDSISLKMLEIKHKYLDDSISDSAYLASIQPHMDSLLLAIQLQHKNMLGKRLPDGILETFDGDFFNIDTLRGKPNVLFFWSETCQPCLDLIPLITSIKNEYGPEINVLAFTSHSPTAITSYLDLHDFDVLHVVNAQAYIKNLGIMTLPSVYVVDRTLVVREILGQHTSSLEVLLLQKKIISIVNQLLFE